MPELDAVDMSSMFAKLDIELHPDSPISSKITVDGKLLPTESITIEASCTDVSMVTLRLPIDLVTVRTVSG